MTRKAAEAALASGDLDTSRAELFNAVRDNPGDAELRAFLFQLCAVLGDWDRAEKQLDVLGELKPDTLDFSTDYKVAIQAERVRAAVWAGEISPSIFGEPREWIAHLVQAQKHEARGEADAAHALRTEALNAAPAEPGQANGEPFQWCADADTRLGPMLEIVLNGEYHWIAMADIAQLEINPPKDLRDLVWAVAIITLASGGKMPAFLPVRYPGAVETGDASVMLARTTDFRALQGEHAAGIGQRMLTTEAIDLPFLEVRDLSFDSAMAAAAAAAAAEVAAIETEADNPADG